MAAKRGGRVQLALVATIAGLALTTAATTGVRSWEATQARGAFSEVAEDRARAVERRIAEELELLRYLAALFAASDRVDRDEFRAFLERPRALQPDLVAIEWLPRVAAEARAGFEAGVSAEGFPGFRIQELDAGSRLVPAGDRPEYFPVAFAEPLEGSHRNRAALGFDYGSRPRRRRAMDDALAQGRPIATEPIPLFRFGGDAERVDRDAADWPAYLVFAPVHDRAGSFLGFVSAVFTVRGLIDQALDGFRADEARIFVCDVTDPDETIVYGGSPVEGEPAANVPLEFAGRNWVLVAAATPEFASDHREWYSSLALAFGLLSTALLARAIGRLASERRRVQEELDRFWALSPDLLCVARTDGTFRRLNPAWEAALGWRLEDLVDRPYASFVHPEDQAVTSREAARLGEGERTVDFENRYRCRDGTYRWLRWTAVGLPRHGLIYAAARDITERVGAREERERLVAELERLSTTDPLTGVLNRRSLGARLEEEARRADRYGRPLAVAMLDGDHFKKVNDTHGHDAGDAVLRRIASTLRQCVRETDAVARFGGEEFVVLLPETPLDDARATADRIREAIARETFPGAGGSAFSITCSLGVAAREPREPVERLLSRVDAALYRAKHGGRDRVEIAG